MSNLRRRADDFTNSLKSFHQTMYEEKQNSIASQRDLEDTSDISIRNRQYESDIHNCQKNNESRASIIISGRLNNQQYVSFAKYRDVEDSIIHNDNQFLSRDILDETSYLSLKFDLNKGTLFQDEQLSKENHTFEEYSNLNSTLSKINKDIDSHHLNENKNVEVQCNLIKVRPYAVSSSSLEDISKKNQDITEKFQRFKSCSMLNSNSKKDTNHNIKVSYFSVVSTPTRKNSREKTDITTLFGALSLSSEPSLLPNKKTDFHSTEEDQQCDSTKNKTSSKEQLNSFELKAFLDSLEYQKPLKEAAVEEHLLRRLSTNFYNSPKTFTERLLTIIEESVMSNDSCAQLEYPEASLCRLTEEVRKMCKFIEDETIPEWPQSPSMSKSICKRRSIKSPSRKSLNAFPSRDKNLATPSISPRRNIKSPKKLCRRMSRNTSYNIKLHDNTSTFESLEAFCERFYADENKTASREKNPLQSPLQSIDNILRVCENQMASLEDSPNIQEHLWKAQTFTPDLARQQNNEVLEEQKLQYRLLNQEKRNKTDSKKVPDIFKQWTGHNKSFEMIEPDDLENTLMYEIAKKRQRCLDTAKVMMEIDTNSKLEEAEQICPNIVITSPTKDDKFMETLMSVKKYQEYLEEHRPILNNFQTESCSTSRISRTPDKKYIRTKKISRENVSTRHLGDNINSATLEVPMRKKSTSPLSPKCSNNIVVSKPKLFVTPGKTPTKKNYKSKRIYFPNLVGGINKEKKPSPDVKNIYRQLENYDHVVSPVGLYIKGTDPHLIKNLRPKTDEKLLTPRKKQIKRSPSPSLKLKFQLSPKLPKKTMTRTVIGNENIADNFLHPKVHYKLPSHVRTIKETENQKMGNRRNELLRSTQDKIVVRHKGRIKSVQTDCLKQPEIHYDSAEESVHVEQTARKTCFSRVQKNY